MLQLQYFHYYIFPLHYNHISTNRHTIVPNNNNFAYNFLAPSSIQTIIMTSSTIGPILGAAFGNYFSDRFGRRPSILTTNRFLFVGGLIFGFGIGLVSMATVFNCPIVI
jgi:MFS family permease